MYRLSSLLSSFVLSHGRPKAESTTMVLQPCCSLSSFPPPSAHSPEEQVTILVTGGTGLYGKASGLVLVAVAIARDGSHRGGDGLADDSGGSGRRKTDSPQSRCYFHREIAEQCAWGVMDCHSTLHS